MATRQNLEFFLGEDWPIEIACRGADGEILNLTDGDVQFRLVMPGLAAITLTKLDGVEITTPLQGEAVIALGPAKQTDIRPGVGEYEIRAILSDGTITDQAFGSFNVRASLFG